MSAKKRRSRRRRWLLIIIVLVVAGGIAAAVLGRGGDEALSVTAEEAERRDLTSVVSATGKIQPQVEVKISSEVPGEIIAIAVVEGQSVAKGDLLVRIDPETLRAQVAQSEAALSATRARSLQAKAQLLQAEQDLQRLQDLNEKGFVSPSEVETQQTTVEVQRANYQASLHQIEQQEMQLDEARDALSKTEVYAPMAGTVIALNSEVGERVVGTGQFAGTEIMRVADLSNMEVRVDVSENDIVHVAVGNEATILVDAITEREFPGEVVEIANSADIESSRSQEQLTTFEVKIKFAETDAALRPGMTATADIRTRTVEEAVSVPLQSVTVRDRKSLPEELKPKEEEAKDDADGETGTTAATDDDGDDEDHAALERRRKREGNLARLVFVVDEGIAKMRLVETGIADDTYIEIVSGVEPGETVISGSYTAITRQLKHEMPVEVRESDGDGNWGGGPPNRD